MYDFYSDLIGGFPLVDVARNVTQADGHTAPVSVSEEIWNTFGLAFPHGFDYAEVYADVPWCCEP